MDLMLWFFLLGMILQGFKFLFSLFTDRYENSEPIFSNPEREVPNLLSSTQKDKLSGTVNYKPEGKEIFIHQSFDQSA